MSVSINGKLSMYCKMTVSFFKYYSKLDFHSGRRNDVGLSLMRHRYVVSTSIRRYFDVM